MAAATKASTTAYLRFSAKPLDETMPTLAISVRTTGSSKQRPKAKISRMTSDRYWSTLASNWIGSAPSPPTDSKLRKNCQASGKMK